MVGVRGRTSCRNLYKELLAIVIPIAFILDSVVCVNINNHLVRVAKQDVQPDKRLSAHTFNLSTLRKGGLRQNDAENEALHFNIKVKRKNMPTERNRSSHISRFLKLLLAANKTQDVDKHHVVTFTVHENDVSKIKSDLKKIIHQVKQGNQTTDHSSIKKILIASGDQRLLFNYVNVINKCRIQHGVSQLKLNSTLIKYSKDLANDLARRDKLEHGPQRRLYGESIYVYDQKKNDAFSMIHLFEELCKQGMMFQYGRDPVDDSHAHFTQMVWKSSQMIGLGIGRNTDTKKVYVVVTFYPRGNIQGEYTTNVLPLQGNKKIPVSDSTGNGGRDTIFNRGKKKVQGKPGPKRLKSLGRPDEFNREGLKMHNILRARHGVPPLTYNKKLADHALDWAQKLAQRDVLEHRPHNRFGENLFVLSSTDPHSKVSASDAIKMWYEEIKFYAFGKEPSTLQSGHFTQVIWKGTKELGMAKATNRNGKIYIVANYNPPGNVISRFSRNVPQPLS